MMMTNDTKDETLIYWTVCVENIIILKVIFGLGKLASASASWFWPRPRPRPRRFVLGLENLSSFNITAKWRSFTFSQECFVFNRHNLKFVA